jgi:dTDP-4-dehydrorhamnose 3,5-epimerase
MKDELTLLYPSVHPGVFEDNRGILVESWRVGEGIKPAKCGLTSFNIKGALRGFHYQRNKPRALIVRCVRGAIWDVAVDIRKGVSTYGRVHTNRLTEAGHEAVYIPAGFAHAFYAMADAIVVYECSDFFDPDSHSGFHWSSTINAWDGIVVGEPVISEKDRLLPPLSSIEPIEV